MHHLNRWTGTVAIVALVGLGLACASDEEKFAEHMKNADEYLDENKSKEALLEFRSALKVDPKNAEVNQRIAEVFKAAGGQKDAAFFYREAYRLDPERIDAAMEEAQLLLFSDTERTEEIIEEGLRRFPNKPSVYVASSQLALLRRDTDKALAAIMTGVSLVPDDLRVWLQVGAVHQARIREQRLVKKEEPDDAVFEAGIKAYERADEIGGGVVMAQIERARILGTWPGHMDEAFEGYRGVVQLAKDLGETDIVLYAADAANQFARRSRAIDMRRWALRELVEAKDSQIRVWDELARLYDGKEKGTGQDIYTELLKRRPEDPMAHSYFASYLVRHDRAPEAVVHLVGVIDAGHGTPGLWEQLLRIHLQDRNLATARATFVQMADAHPDDPLTERAEARIALAENRHERAAEILRGLVGKAENFETLRMLAFSEYLLGNLPAATAAIDRSLALSGSFSAEAARLKARIHHDAGDWVLALRTIRTLLGRNVTLNADERLMRAQVLYETGRGGVGREVLELLLNTKEPAKGTAVEYSKREGARTPIRAYRYLVRAWDRAPLDYDILSELMKLDIANNRAELTLKRVNSVINTGRASPKVLLLRADLLSRSGDFDAAEADALRAFEAAPQLPGAADLLLAIYRAQGRIDEALRSFEEAEQAGVLHSGARLLLGRLYLSQGNVARAREMFEIVLAENPNSFGAKNDLSFLLAEAGEDLDRALRLAQDAQELRSGNPNAVDTVGYVFLRKGLYEAALQRFRYAIELSKKSDRGGNPAAYYYHAGLALRALGRDVKSARFFENALELDEDFRGAEDARSQLEAARAATPDSPSAS